MRHLCGIFWWGWFTDVERCEGVAPSMWHILAIGWFMDVRRYEGVAPSMWHILVRLVYGCREIWGSCAIYVGIPSLILVNEWELRHLCPKKAAWCWEKNVGGNQRRRLQKMRSFLGTYMTQLTCFEWELSHLSPAFCIWHRWRHSRFWASTLTSE